MSGYRQRGVRPSPGSSVTRPPGWGQDEQLHKAVGKGSRRRDGGSQPRHQPSLATKDGLPQVVTSSNPQRDPPQYEDFIMKSILSLSSLSRSRTCIEYPLLTFLVFHNSLWILCRRCRKSWWTFDSIIRLWKALLLNSKGDYAWLVQVVHIEGEANSLKQAICKANSSNEQVFK